MAWMSAARQSVSSTRVAVAHAELDRREERVRAQVPPDLPAVVDRRRLHEQLDEVLVLVVAREVRRDAGAWEATPDHLAVRLQPGVAGEPERRRRRDREEMRKEVARLVHHLDACLAIGDPDVDMQTEDEEFADHVLQLVLEDLVALGLGDLLILPVRERVRPRRGDAQARGLEQRRERAAQGRDLGAGFADVGADLRARLDDRLHHLGLDLLAEARRRSSEQRLAVAFQLPVAVDDLELFLNTDRETRNIRLPHLGPPAMT
jgi:hypothetical protein